MSAVIRCQHCRRDVLVFDLGGLVFPAAGELLACEWAGHVADCERTCDHCGRIKAASAACCQDQRCRKAERLRRAGDRVADVQTLLVRTSDAEWIAQQVGLQSAVTLRAWLRRHGRADLVTGDGPLAPDKGVAA
jgi:hypothetical protein